MIFALVGNQNCGKTTLFNALTGSNQHVGNFPGVTVDQKMGEIIDERGCSVVDLPGIYSLRPYTQEEIVSRDFILNQKPDGIINIVDATNIERNLYLTLQLLELRIPMVLALNMMDEVRSNGGSIDVQKMSQALGIPVETSLLMLLRPVSGSTALSVSAELIARYGADSLVGRTAAVMIGSSETTLYVVAVYFTAAGVKDSRWAIPAALCADLACFLSSAWICRILWG